jgi:Na+-translocating ferredoxin:NAD+ oxidoreductase RnfG subunit
MRDMLNLRVAVIVIGAGLFLAGVTSANSQQEQQQTPNESKEILKEILKDSQKQDPETPKELAECMNQWGPNTQMTKEEWAASCRSTLNYFPE